MIGILYKSYPSNLRFTKLTPRNLTKKFRPSVNHKNDGANNIHWRMQQKYKSRPHQCRSLPCSLPKSPHAQVETSVHSSKDPRDSLCSQLNLGASANWGTHASQYFGASLSSQLNLGASANWSTRPRQYFGDCLSSQLNLGESANWRTRPGQYFGAWLNSQLNLGASANCSNRASQYFGDW